MTTLKKRILYDAILFCLVFWLPWLLTIIVGLSGVLYFVDYYEFLVTGLIIDSIYSAKIASYHDFQFVVSIVCAVLFIVLSLIRKKLRFEWDKNFN